MDSTQSSLSDQCHKDDIVIMPLVPGPTAVKARPGDSVRDPDWYASPTISPPLVDITAEETCPAAEMPAQDGTPQLAPDIEIAAAPSASNFELMSQLEALASDLAVNGLASPGQRIGDVHERSDLSSELSPVEPSISVSPRPAGFENDQVVNDGRSIGRRGILTLASCLMAALVGLGIAFAWNSQRLWTVTSPAEVDVAARQPDSAPAGRTSASNAAIPQPAPVTQSATAPGAPAASPELVKQLETMTQDLASVRRGIDELTAAQQKLEQLAAKQEQLAAKQEQLAAKQDQMTQNIAKLQTLGQNAKLRTSPPQSPPPQFRAVPMPPRVPAEPTAQLSPVPRPPTHPVPPLPVPP
jgi:hypothetical protein